MDSYQLALLSEYGPNLNMYTTLKDMDVSACVPDEPKLPKSGYTSLHFSVLEDNLKFIQRLLNLGADPLKQGTYNGRTPLLEFITKRPYYLNTHIYKLTGKLGKHPIVNLLLSEQVERKDAVNPRCIQTGMSHLHVACIVDHWQAVELFLQAGESVNQTMGPGDCSWTPLHLAVRYSAIAAAKILIYHEANIHLKDACGLSPLHRLVERVIEVANNLNFGKPGPASPMLKELKRLEMIVALILKSRKKNELNFVDDIGLSIFHVACTLRDSYMVEDMLKGEVDVNAQTSSVDSSLWPGWTALHFAACCSVDSVKLLVQNGADLTKKNADGDSPLDFCARRYSPRILHSILATKEEFQSIVMSDGSTRLLDLILAMDDCEEFKKLENVDLQVPSDSPIWPGCNVLHLAILMHERYLDPRDYLCSLVDVDIITKQVTCTEEEEKSYWKRIVVCLARRCSISTKNVAGQTPLHLAFHLRKANVVDKLLNCCNAGNEVDNDGISFLHIACALGKMNVVERFVVDKNVPTINKFRWPTVSLPGRSTPLHIATAFDQREVVDYLLRRGADMHARDAMGFTPIHLSMKSTAPLFLGRSGLKEVVSKDGLSHLHVAAASNDERAIEVLVRRGTIDVNSRFKPCQSINFLKLYNGRTPLHVAVERKCWKAISALVQAGADIHASTTRSRYDTPLQGAMLDEPNDLLTLLVKKLRRDKRSKGPIDECGVTLLHFACAIFDSRWTKRLLDKGADPNAIVCDDEEYDGGWKGYTAMHVLLVMASEAKTRPRNLVDMVKLLLRHGADVTMVSGGGWSPVMVADRLAEEAREREEKEAEENKEEKKSTETNEEKMSTILLSIADLLLNHQKSYAINPSTPLGETHFHFACKRNNLQIVRKFLANGTNPNHSTYHIYVMEDGGYTPLHFAFEHNALEVALLLLDRGADVRIVDVHGNTPMHIAARNNVDDVELLEAMWSFGANVKAENFLGAKPLDLLIHSDNVSYDELRFFLDRGCKIDVERNPESVGLLLNNANLRDLQLILELLFNSCDLVEQIRSGYNVIHSLVGVIPDNGRWTVDMYLGAIRLFMDAGCKLEQRDISGKTALHVATACWNAQATEALLLLGADINITDYGRQTPNVGDDLSEAEKRHVDRTLAVLANHVWRMRFVGLNIHKSNTLAAKPMWMNGYLDMSIKRRCEEELERLAHTKLSERWNLRDLLLSTWRVAFGYQGLPLEERRRVDETFADHKRLREQFPEFCGLLMMKHREMREITEICWSMGNAVATLLKLEVSDECFKEMFMFLVIPVMMTCVDEQKRSSFVRLLHYA